MASEKKSEHTLFLVQSPLPILIKKQEYILTSKKSSFDEKYSSNICLGNQFSLQIKLFLSSRSFFFALVIKRQRRRLTQSFLQEPQAYIMASTRQERVAHVLVRKYGKKIVSEENFAKMFVIVGEKDPALLNEIMMEIMVFFDDERPSDDIVPTKKRTFDGERKKAKLSANDLLDEIETLLPSFRDYFPKGFSQVRKLLNTYERAGRHRQIDMLDHAYTLAQQFAQAAASKKPVEELQWQTYDEMKQQLSIRENDGAVDRVITHLEKSKDEEYEKLLKNQGDFVDEEEKVAEPPTKRFMFSAKSYKSSPSPYSTRSRK